MWVKMVKTINEDNGETRIHNVRDLKFAELSIICSEIFVEKG